ncbi:DUF3858 domain-containing protein, partial [Chryseobacterium sp. Alg-005]|uniref:DUF3858 domain-containing protein n=1 Tax=Chryseobacterium sp. Alg-005 TaxID=3159516 RepID=UPI0036F3ABE2
NVLSIKKNGIELIDTPVYTADKNKEKQILKVKLSEDNSISGAGLFEYTGSQYDYSLVYSNLSPKERNESLKNQLDVLNFEKVEMKDFVNDRDHAVSKYNIDFKANNYSKNAGSSMIFRAVPIFANTIYKTDDNRELPFEIGQSFEDEYQITFEIPKNYKIEEIPDNVTINSEFGSYTLNIIKEGENLKVNRTVRVNKGIYPKEKYNDYVSFRKKMNGLDNSKILITKI